MNHEWKVCKCTECQAVQHAIEDARAEGAQVMLEKIIGLAKQFGVPGMAIAALKALPLPERKFK